MSESFILLLIACVIIVVLIILCVNIAHKNKNLYSDILDKTKEISDYINSTNQLKERIQRLSKFQNCVNAEDKAAEIIRLAEEDVRRRTCEADDRISKMLSEAESRETNTKIESERILSEANQGASSIIAAAKSEASDYIARATQKAKNNLQKSEDSLSDAIAKARAIIDEAENKARIIAGEAYDVSKNVEFYENALTSIKNIIKGYGLTYIKPLDSVLDGLAKDYGFSEAGRELTQARNHTRLLVESQRAAYCDYVEPNRRDTAIAFVLDAFNGKVDSIMSLLKTDNYGILEQKIKDSYSVVNLLGKPFREARIAPEYLEARLSELKWGAAVFAIKLKEKEEQRIIKERIREEERARREYERAIKEAEKQEQTIRKAIEKATAQLEKANAEQKLKYEAQLIELQSQLTEAEAKNQRALSMAQQTRSGHVYIISNIGSFGEDVFKIGMTRRLEPLDRVRELGDASVPFPFDVHAMIYSEDAPALETELHKIFSLHQVNKVNPRKEFFRLPISKIKNYLDQKAIEIRWTISAEAAQYRETLALEESFRKDYDSEAKWIKEQEGNYMAQLPIDDLEEE